MKFWELPPVDLEDPSQNVLVFHVFDASEVSR